ncbi:amidohydrolase [Candidatus Bathyarchaeota archaeon]|nr:amidohydrolase [Candidatus Bathyarchaeota archaeon]
MNSRQPKAEAIAIVDNRILAVGSNEEICGYISDRTRVIDADGKTVVPGFIDCHVHMTKFEQYLQTLDLRNAYSIDEIKREIRKYAKENPGRSWILGGRWDHEKFSERRYPTRWDLDEAVSVKPVLLIRVCGHIGVANTKALEIAGIGKETHVNGGIIDKDPESGEPNGILRENALSLVWRVIPKPSMTELQEACIRSCQKAVENGLTMVHWIVDSADEIRIIQKLYNEGKIPLRIYLGIPVELLDELFRLGLITGFGNDMVRLGFVKIFVDGSLGGHTAALKQPYVDKPETSGMLIYTQRKLDRLIMKAHEACLQVAVHAIGDKAIESSLKAFSNALKKFPRRGHRHRIEHCSVLNSMLIKRMKKLGLIASIQPHFVVSDFWVIDRVGYERARWIYPFKTLMDEGIIVVSGSDCPVEPINPLLGIWAMVARKNFSEESLTVEEAFKTYTLNAAYASFDEDKKGTIEVGKLADLTVLSEDPFNVPQEGIKNISVEMNIVGGEIVYTRA